MLGYKTLEKSAMLDMGKCKALVGRVWRGLSLLRF